MLKQLKLNAEARMDFAAAITCDAQGPAVEVLD